MADVHTREVLTEIFKRHPVISENKSCKKATKFAERQPNLRVVRRQRRLLGGNHHKIAAKDKVFQK